MNEILKEALEIQDFVKEARHELHRNAEFGFYIPKTAEYVKKKLTEIGVTPIDCSGPVDKKTGENFKALGVENTDEFTGVLAVIGSGEPCILLRADMDALNMKEAEGLVEFRSLNDNAAHMCGHDTHAAMLLGAAKILKNHESELKGSVKLMFQPGEECGCGARLMCDNGALENPKPDASFAIHIAPQEKTGTVVYTPGIASGALDTYIVRIKGKGGHSSTPQACIDAVFIANQLYQALNLLPGREVDPRETVALAIGAMGGGTAANIISETAEVSCGVRTFNREAREHLNKRIPEIIEHVVKMWRGEYQLVEFHTPSTYVDPEMCVEMENYMKAIVGLENVNTIPCPVGAEDFGHITERVPGVQIYLGGGNSEAKPLHSPEMVVDEDALASGAAIYANVAIEWLKNNN